LAAEGLTGAMLIETAFPCRRREWSAHSRRICVMFNSVRQALAMASFGLILSGLAVPGAHGQYRMPFMAPAGTPARSTALIGGATGQGFSPATPFLNTINPYSPMGSIGFGSSYGLGYGSMYSSGMSGYASSYGSQNGAYDQNYSDSGAGLVRAQGDFLVKQQQSFLLREQVRAQRSANAAEESRRSASNSANASNVGAERDASSAKQVVRANIDTPLTEIWSGATLNHLLSDLQRRPNIQDAATQKDALPVDDRTLSQINFTRGKGHIGLLKNGEHLDWPQAFIDSDSKDSRDRFNGLLLDVVEQARCNGSVDRNTLKKMASATDDFHRHLRKKCSDLSPATYREAKRFLKDLDDALTALKRPDVGSLFACSAALQSQTVPELVQFMTKHQLQFAPALPNERSAYAALHRALANYSNLDLPLSAHR
jgi:hypothetical protein